MVPTVNCMWNIGRKKVANFCADEKLHCLVNSGHVSTVHWTMKQWTVEAYSAVSAGPGPVKHAKCIEPGPT
jgi:hypothetical protein